MTRPVLVWKASTDTMNPSLAAQVAQERAKDPTGARIEYDAEFDADAGSFLLADQIEAVVESGRYELAPREGVRYLAAADPAGGTVGGDAFALAIVHAEGGGGDVRIVQDVCRSWKGRHGQALELRAVCGEIAAILHSYGLARVVGDHYAWQWPIQAFRDVGVSYVPAERDKSGGYIELEPWIATARCALLDHEVQTRELGLLEKRLKPGGKRPVIDHPKGAHDDHANALALAVAELAVSLHPPATVTRESLETKLAPQQALDQDAHRAAGSLLGDDGRGPLRFHGTGGRERQRFWR